jgi:predicted TIM-barrel fold metal-dependent hydrolase
MSLTTQQDVQAGSTPVTYDVISADSHVVEPHDLWQRYIDPAYRARAPRLVHDTDTDRLVCDQAELPPVGLLAGCARGDEEVRQDGRWDADVFRGGYDPEARLVDLARDGVDGEVLYPTIAMQMYPVTDADFQWALFRAYNTWLGEEFCAAHPERFWGIGMLNHEDVDRAIAELRRCRSLGLVGVMVPMFTDESNDYQNHRFDPLWAAACELEMPVNLHAATTRDRSKAWNKGTPTDGVLRHATQIQQVLLDMIFSGLFDRFPSLMVVSAENDVGWASSMLERADYWWHRNRNVRASKGSACAEPPSVYFHRNVRVTFMRDHTGILAADIIGPETIMWGNDFPHHVSTWPRSREVLAEHFDGRPGQLRNRIVRDNVRALYRI